MLLRVELREHNMSKRSFKVSFLLYFTDHIFKKVTRNKWYKDPPLSSNDFGVKVNCTRGVLNNQVDKTDHF